MFSCPRAICTTDGTFKLRTQQFCPARNLLQKYGDNWSRNLNKSLTKCILQLIWQICINSTFTYAIVLLILVQKENNKILWTPSLILIVFQLSWQYSQTPLYGHQLNTDSLLCSRGKENPSIYFKFNLVYEQRTRSPKTTAKLIYNNVYCFL